MNIIEEVNPAQDMPSIFEKHFYLSEYGQFPEIGAFHFMRC